MNIRINRYHLILFGILIIGSLLRIFYFVFYYNEPSDVIRFMHASRFLLGEEDDYGAPREIGYPIALALFGIIFGVSYDTARILTIILGIFNIFIAYVLTKRVLDRWGYIDNNQNEIALFTSLLVAVSPIIARSDNLGIREPLAGMLLMLSVILLYTPKGLGTNQITEKLDIIFVFIVWFCLSITRSEFIIIGVGIACFVALEGWQFSEVRTKIKALSIGCASIIAFIFWSILSISMFGNPTATSDMLVKYIMLRNDPSMALEAQGLTWYIFDYKGLFNFLIIEIVGVSTLLTNLSGYLGPFVFILAVFGGLSMIKRSHLLIPTLYVLMAIINGFNAYEWEFIGSDRILSISFPFLFILAAIAFEQIKDFDFKLTTNYSIHIPKIFSKIVVAIFAIVYSLAYSLGFIITA